jgi:hypothetical protein
MAKAKRKGYKAVVESGSRSSYGVGRPCIETNPDGSTYESVEPYYEERVECGHLHKTVEAAEACGKRNYAAKYVHGSWQASAQWHGYTIHDQDGCRC